jgi:ribosomal protein S8E
MKINWPGWRKGIQPKDKDQFLGLVTTGDEKMDTKTDILTTQYKPTTADLSLEELGQLKDILARGMVPYVPIEDVRTIDQELLNRKSPAWIEAQARKLRERREGQAATELRLLQLGNTKLGGAGTKWQDRKNHIDAWWADVQTREARETWQTAFTTNRISARQIGSTKTMGGNFTVRNKFERANRSRDRNISLDRGASGILERMKPANFDDPKTGKSQKNEKGLHDLSASLLDGKDKDPMSIFVQLKPYDNAVVLFMPAPSEDDAQIFNAIMQLTEPDEKLLRTIRSKFTRIRFAQGSDMHTIPLDVSRNATDLPKIRYGVSGRTQRAKDESEVMADDIDLAARRTNALQHSVILGPGAMQKVNEIVMVYRSYESTLFPLFAKWDAQSKRFNVVDKAGLLPTGAYITDGGAWFDRT